MVGAALANEKKNLKKTLTLQEESSVKDLVLKKGSYLILFDATPNEF